MSAGDENGECVVMSINELNGEPLDVSNAWFSVLCDDGDTKDP